MTANPENQIRREAAADPPNEPKTAVAVENWENEGGHSPSLPNASITPSDVSPVVRDQATASDGLIAMRAKFFADFAGGSVGQYHNTYQRRSRVLGQPTGERPQ